MSYKKYLQDYRVEEYTDKKGRVKSTAVYIGGDYILSPAVSVKDRRWIMAASILCWLALIGALIPKTNVSQLYYILLSFIFSALPLYFMTGAAVTLLSESDRMTRERAERISSRLPLCSIFTAILSGLAFIGVVITAFFSWNDMIYGDILFGALSLFITVAASFAFSKCRGIKANKVENE